MPNQTHDSDASNEPADIPGAANTRSPLHLVTIFLVSLAGLLLEVSLTRVVSFKLWYYYVYLVLGLALLGIGSGGVLVAISRRLKAIETNRIVAACGLAGAVTISVSYFVVARVPINTVAIWDYGSSESFSNLAVLFLISLMLFASFVPLGVILSVLLGRSERVGKLYFADLVGAALGCLAAIPFISHFGPPVVVMMAAAIFAAAGLLCSAPWLVRRPGSTPTAAASPAPTAGAADLRRINGLGKVSAVALGLLLIPTLIPNVLPDVEPEKAKVRGVTHSEFHKWGPVFRVDVVNFGRADLKHLAHDATFGSGIRYYDGKPEQLTAYDTDPRSLPFAALGHPSEHTLIIGSAGGNEILTSLHFKTKKVDAVELNPVTVSILRKYYNEWTGDLPSRAGVNIHNADGRSYVARSKDNYDLVWFVAPDSYAANNAVSSGAFVLSESYLYTSDMIKNTLEHLSSDGIMVVQFGEVAYERFPYRSSRYLMTARAALEKMGIKDPNKHLLMTTYLTPDFGDQVVIMVKSTPFTQAEIDRVAAKVPDLPRVSLAYAPGREPDPGIAPRIAAAATQAEANDAADDLPIDVSEVTDDAPFFWHFHGFRQVANRLTTSVGSVDPDAALGERVLILLFLISVIYAAVFLLLPFRLVRRRFAQMPAKATAGVYFAAIGLGFILLEIALIQKLTLLLGYPTLSLTVTLASILFSTGVGALVSPRIAGLHRNAMGGVLASLFVLILLYQFGLSGITDAVLSQALLVRAIVTFLLLLPLGLCLGMFMPLGLEQVKRLTSPADDYVAWSWAVNGFFSVIGSVSTTMLSMTFGFRVVMFISFLIYCVAVGAYVRLRKAGDASAPTTPAPAVDDTLDTHDQALAGV